MEKHIEVLEVELKEAFNIANASTSRKSIVVLTLAHPDFDAGSVHGWGEAALSIKSPETVAQVRAFLDEIPDHRLSDPSKIKEIMEYLDELHEGLYPAKCAVDMALYDLNGKVLGQPVYTLFELEKFSVSLSFVTFGLGTEEETLRKAKEHQGFPFIKVKVDSNFDIGLLVEIAKITGGKLAIDGNEGWDVDEAIDKINSIVERVPLEFVEQPIKRKQVKDLKKLKANTKVPIFLDEDIVTKRDVEAMAPYIDGINVKLMKCGGIYKSIELISLARQKNLRVLLGCMVETSLGISAAAHIAHLADYLDLDGNRFLKSDPYMGAFLHKGKLILPGGNGLGVIEKSHAH